MKLFLSKCFISHAYEDAARRDQLIRTLPRHVEAVTLPALTVKPDEFVSDRLIEALLGCDGLIYLRGEKSAQSFWVAFERDYALRAGKQVFAADPVTLELARDTRAPLDLATFACYAHDNTDRVLKIADYLIRERYFDLWLDVANLKGDEDFQNDALESLTDRLKREGKQ